MTTDKTDAELIALVKADMLKPGHMTCESCRLSVEEMIARNAELAQTAERLTHAKEGYALVYDAAIAMANDRAEKAEAALAASAKDAGRFEWLQQRMYSVDYQYGDPPTSVIAFKWPPEARIGINLRIAIDAAIAQTEERIDQAAAQAQIDRLGFCSQQQTEGLGK